MENYKNYKRGYFLPPKLTYEWAKKEYIDKAPIWCSVDLRDGNQSLIIPMSLDEKVEFFKLLVKIGFKEIEVGFPAASDTEYEFLRKLINDNLIPDDVTIQVLTQAREHIIKKTYEALEGCKSAIVHLYNSTSLAQREQVFKKSKEEILNLAVEGAKLVKKYAEETKGNFKFEYSPESFTGTEVDYALDVCNAVLDVWQPTENNKVIINLPVTVSMSLPHIYASQIEYMSNNMKYRENVYISLHPHNDRGCAVADSELGLLAGGDRIEGTLFGNGERTGNVDIVTLSLNMYSHGVNPELDFSDMPSIVELYERVTRMNVYERQPYSGKLVFAAFSGSHQDAIAKGMKYREENNSELWSVPYLPIDPKDVNREYETDVIRINSQSGKGGIGYIMEHNFGFNLPPKMREELGYTVKGVSDKKHQELSPKDVYDIFTSNYLQTKNYLALEDVHFFETNEVVKVVLNVAEGNKKYDLTGKGNGRLSAVNDALINRGIKHSIDFYTEHALQTGAKAEAVAYVCIEYNDKKIWAAGIDEDILIASIKGLFNAINKIENIDLILTEFEV